MTSPPDPNHPAGLTTWPALVGLTIVGFLLGIFGTYWDDAWHTDRGRDSLLIAPHLILYLGIIFAGGALSWWGCLAARRSGWRVVLVHPPLVLALLGVSLTLVAAPVDNAWHLAFGRDAVIWSAPHMLGVAGSLAIAAGLLLELARPVMNKPCWSPWATMVAGAALIAVCVLPVLEYETDVPQFAPVFYLPILASGSAFAFGLIAEAVSGRWPVARAALAYCALMAVVALVLVISGLPAPLVPLLIVPAVGFDYSRRRLPLTGRALLIATLIFAAYVPYLNWAKSGLYLDVSDVAFGVPMAFLGAVLALWLIDGPRLPSRPHAVVGPTVLALIALPLATALAHDPGQGDEVGTATIEAVISGQAADLTVIPDDETLCKSLEPVATVARRGGKTVRGPLGSEPGCLFIGTVRLPERGRWFVYAEFLDRGRPVETWLAVDNDAGRTSAPDRALYLPERRSGPLTQKLAGIAVYSLFAATLVVIPALYRRQRQS